jgi:hypothetical protein
MIVIRLLLTYTFILKSRAARPGLIGVPFTPARPDLTYSS